MNAGDGRPQDAPILHATLIAARRRGRWCGVLLQGPSGAGKSDLALRAVAADWRLVADDRVRVWTSGPYLYGGAPATLAGLIEVRGLGVISEGALPFSRLVLVMKAAAPQAPVERMPEPVHLHLLGIALPRLDLTFREPAAVAKLERALDAALQREL